MLARSHPADRFDLRLPSEWPTAIGVAEVATFGVGDQTQLLNELLCGGDHGGLNFLSERARERLAATFRQTSPVPTI